VVRHPYYHSKAVHTSVHSFGRSNESIIRLVARRRRPCSATAWRSAASMCAALAFPVPTFLSPKCSRADPHTGLHGLLVGR